MSVNIICMNTKKAKILSVLSVIGHPRDSKRISMISELNYKIEAVAFERDYHKGRLPECDVIFLGKISHGKYLNRIFKMILALPKIRKAVKKNDLIYASGLDMAAMSLIARIGLKKPLIVEIGDIREIQVQKGLKGSIVRWFDKKIVNSSSLIVVTSPPFLNIYYRQWIGTTTKGLIIENKLEGNFLGNEYIDKIDNDNLNFETKPFRIGYFGLLRDEWSLKVLKAWALSNPDKIEIVLAGLPMEHNIETIENMIKINNIKYMGQYKSPQDLPKIYGSVDMVWACYPAIHPDDWNLKWARPNRFYESCFFQKPTFTRSGCQDAIDVIKFDIGKIIEGNEIEEVVSVLNTIKINDLLKWKENMKKLPDSVYIYTSESSDLNNAIEEILIKNKI